MTQDSGDWWNSTSARSAMHILAGAVAGLGGRNGQDALYRGIQTGNALQNAYQREQQFKYQMQQQQKFDQYKEENYRLENQYKQKRLEMMDQDMADDQFLNEVKTLRQLSSGRAMQYYKDSTARLTAQRPTDGSLTYPINEKEAEVIQSITKGHETLADIDLLIHSMHESEVGGSKKAKAYAKILGLKHGITTAQMENGKKYIKTPFGAFPMEYESAGKIKALYEKDVAMMEAKLSDLWQTRHRAESGAQKFMLKRMDDLVLDPKTKIQIAEQYVKEVGSNDIMSRTLDFTHTAGRLLSAKDPEMAQYEVAELVGRLKKADVKFHQSKETGEYYIDGKSFNDYINRFNPNEKVEVLPETGMVRVDNNTLMEMRERSGLDRLANEYFTQSKSLSEGMAKTMAQKAQAELDFDFQKKLNTQRATVAGEEISADAKEKRIQNDVKRNRLAKYSYEEIVDNTPELRQNPEVLDMLDTEASEWVYRTKKNSTAFKKLDDQFRNQFGTSLKKAVEGSDEDEDGTMQKFALNWLKENTETSKVVSPKMLENYKKNLVRKFLRNPDAYMKNREKVSSFNKTQEKANQQIKKFNNKAAKQNSNELDAILSLGEK